VKTSLALCTAIVMTIAVPRAHDLLTTRVTWTVEIAPIIAARCASCHTAGGSAPMPLTTYDQARPWARAIKEAALVRHMPNWRAARGYGDFLDDPSLSPFEIALVSAWADGGAPRGTEAQRVGSQVVDRRSRVAGHGSNTVAVTCGETPLPPGRLLALQPRLEKDQSAGIAVQFPDGRREIVAWIRDYDPRFPTTYWLRTPIQLPRGSILITEGITDGAAKCALDLTITGR
jgi:hypothetical protein